MRFLRIIGRLVLAVLAFVALALGFVYARTEWLANRTLPSPPKASLVVNHDSTTVALGEHVVKTMGGCADCHGDNLGGKVMVDEPMIMRLAAPNLTTGKGGVLPNYSDDALEAVIRHGVKYNGGVLRFMPSHEMSQFANDHVAAIIAYLRAQPAVDNVVPDMSIGPVIRVLAVLKKVTLFPYDRIDHTKRAVANAPTGSSIELGKYIGAGCIGCHGDGLSGGKIPGAPPDWPAAANITPTGLHSWSEDDFIRTMRTGINPSGHKLDGKMPWKQLGQMTDDELRALRRYLATVPPKATGTR